MLPIPVAALLAAFTACSEPSSPPPALPAAPPVAPAEPSAVADPLSSSEILAPSPLELEAQVRAAGIEAGLAALVPAALPPMPPPEQKDRVAFRTGVVFAYTLFSGRALDKPTLLVRVTELRDGMATLGTGQGFLASIDMAIEHIRNDAGSRDDFLAELDGLVESAYPEAGWGPADTTGPLLQAGAWLAGMHLVAQAVVEKGDPAAAQSLLRHPEIPAFFLKYVTAGEGSDKAGALRDSIVTALQALQRIGEKPSLGVDDARAVVEATGGLLRLE